MLKKTTKNNTGKNGAILAHEWGGSHVSRVRVTLGHYRGKRLLDVRRFYAKDTAGEIMLPTKKGISIPVEHLPELEKAVTLARKKLGKVVETRLLENGAQGKEEAK